MVRCTCLPEQVIEETVQRLPTTKVVAFLGRLIAKLEARPSRGQGLAKWIRAVLVLHTAHLMSVPGLVPKLSGLYQVCVAAALVAAVAAAAGGIAGVVAGGRW